MKKPIYTLSLICASALVVGTSPFVFAGQEQNPMLQCRIDAVKSAKAGQAIQLKFTLTNNSNNKLAVLKWNTPLEGWFGSSFNVTRDGQWVTYTGAMVKRFRPSEEDYTELAPGKSVEATVDMTQGYDMKAAGNYKLVFNGRLQDVQEVSNDATLSQQRTLQTLKCNELTVTVE